MLQDCAFEEHQAADGSLVYTGKVKQRLCLVLDCLCAHDFSSRNADLLNLQHYVIREKKLSEKEAIIIFCDTVRVVNSLHKVESLCRETAKLPVFATLTTCSNSPIVPKL